MNMSRSSASSTGSSISFRLMAWNDHVVPTGLGCDPAIVKYIKIVSGGHERTWGGHLCKSRHIKMLRRNRTQTPHPMADMSGFGLGRNDHLETVSNGRRLAGKTDTWWVGQKPRPFARRGYPAIIPGVQPPKALIPNGDGWGRWPVCRTDRKPEASEKCQFIQPDPLPAVCLPKT